MDFPCVLCFRNVVKPQERYLIKGKENFKVTEELKSLPFDVTISTKFICKRCLSTLKKRRGLVENLKDINNEFERIYKSNNIEDTPSAQKRHGDSDEPTITTKKLCSEHLEYYKVDDPSGPCTSTVSTSSESYVIS